MNTLVNNTKAHISCAAQHKGGVGKSTLTVLVADTLGRRGFKVLLVDLDEQCNSSELISRERLDSFEHNIKTLVQDYAKEAISSDHNPEMLFNLQKGIYGGEYSSLENVDFIPGSKLDLTKPFDAVCGELSTYNNEIIKNMLQGVVDNYDFILMDCPPALENITRNALVASNNFISPVNGVFSVDGLSSLEKEISKIYRLNRSLGLMAIINNNYDSRQIVNQATAQEAKSKIEGGILGKNLFSKEVISVPKSTAIEKTQYAKCSIFDLHTVSERAPKNVLESLNGLADLYIQAKENINK